MCVRRTTIVLDDGVYRDLRRKAAESGRTMKALVNEVLRDALRGDTPQKTGYKFVWKTERGQIQPGVNLDNWNELEDYMNGMT